MSAALVYRLIVLSSCWLCAYYSAWR